MEETSGSNSLSYTVNLDISEAKKNAEELAKAYANLQVQATSINITTDADSSNVQITSVTTSLNDLGTGLANNKDKVADYKKALNGLETDFGKLVPGANDFITTMQTMQDVISNLSTLYTGFSDTLNTIQAAQQLAIDTAASAVIAQDALTAGTITAQEAQETFAIAQAASAAATEAGTVGMAEFKVALASTGVGALVVVLGSLVAYFTETQEGIDEVSSAVEPLKIGFSFLTKAAADLGKGIINIFSADGIKNFGQILENQVINRFKALGVIMDGLIHLDLTKVLDGVVQSATGIVNPIEKVGAGLSKVSDIASQVSTLKAQRDKQDASQDLNIQKQSNIVSKSESIANDPTKSAATRAAAVKAGLAAITEELRLKNSLLELNRKIADLENTGKTPTNASTKASNAITVSENDNIKAAEEQRKKLTTPVKVAIAPKTPKAQDTSKKSLDSDKDSSSAKDDDDDNDDDKEIENDKKTYAAQKILFDEYQAYKLQFGQTAADKRYSSDITKYQTYAKYLEAQKPPESDVSDSASDKRDLINTLSVGANADTANAAKKQYDALISQTQSYQDKSTSLFEVYHNKVNALGVGATKDQLQVLLDSYTTDDEALRTSVVNKSEYYQQLNQNVVSYTKEQLQAQIEAIQGTLSSATGLTDKLRGELTSKLGALNVKLNLGGGDTAFNADLEAKKKAIQDTIANGVDITDADGNTSKVQLTTAEYNAQIAALTQVNEQLDLVTKKKFDGISTNLKAVSGDFSAISGALKDLNPGLADTFQTLADIANAGASAATAVGQFSTGDIIGGIGSSISAVTKLVSVFTSGNASAKKAAADLKTYQDSLVTGQITYNELLRSQALTAATITDATLAQLEAKEKLLVAQKSETAADEATLLAKIQSQGQQITGEHTEKKGGFLGIGKKTSVVQDTAGVSNADYDTLLELYTEGKLTDSTKTWFEALQKVHDESTSIATETQATQDAINQSVTGTTASSISDSIIQGFKDGKRSATDFAGDFKTLMSNAMYSAIESNYLTPAIDAFYKKFADASKDGLTADEEASLKDEYNGIIANASAQSAEVDKITGGTAPTTAVSGTIVGQAITEDTANRALGIWIGQYDTVKSMSGTIGDMYVLATQNFSTTIAIAENTLRTANNTDGIGDKLDKIVSNTSPVATTSLDQTLRNNGIKG